MNTSHQLFRIGVVGLVVGLMGTANHGAAAEEPRLDASCMPQLTVMDQRVYQKAHEGVRALRQFVSIRHGIVSRDTGQAAEWAADLDRARVRCVDDRATTAQRSE